MLTYNKISLDKAVPKNCLRVTLIRLGC